MADAPARLTAALADRYRLERELGEGGMATVYLAHDLKHDRRVAIKVLRPELAAVIGAERFLVEIRTTANLQHPHILPLFDSGEADSFLFYVMPFVEGETLRERLARETQLPVPEAVRLATEIAGALDYAHRRGVVHRDIKPENVMLHEGRALVADFGIALAMANTNAGRMTETGMSLGTPHYMSPEQAMGEREIGPRSDVYALGCVLYEMLAGEPPFTGPSAQAIVARVLSEEPRALTTQRKTVPPGVEDAVRTTLEKLPADRFATAAEFAAALADGANTRAGTALHTTHANRDGARFPRVAALLAGVAAVSVAFAAWGWLRTTDPASSAGSVAFSIDQTGPLGIVFQADISDQIPLAISPDGQTLAYVVRPGDVAMIAVRALDQVQPLVLAGTEDVKGGLTFSPDGRSLAFVQRRALRRMALDGTPPVDIVADIGQPTSLFSIVWLPGDTIYYSQVGRQAFSRVSASGVTAPVSIPFPDSGATFSSMRRLPGTPWLLMSRIDPSQQYVVAFSTETGAFRTLDFDATGAVPTRDGRAILLARSNRSLTIAPFDPQTLTLTGPEVLLVSGLGGSEVALSNSLTLSPSGTLAYLARTQRDNRLVEVMRSGAERALPANPDGYKDPRWSPDRTRVSFTLAAGSVVGNLFVDDLRAGTRTRLTTENQDLYPLWSRDGSALVFASIRGGRLGSYRTSADGTSEPVPLQVGKQTIDGHPQSVTPDGRTLLYRLNRTGSGADLFAASMDGAGEARPLLTGNADELSPEVSPDQRWLVYTSLESGRHEVYVTAWPGLGARRQLSSGGGEEPRWNPRGGELFYRTGDAFVSVTLEEREGLPSAARRDTLFRGSYRSEERWPQYDVSADGQRFLMVREGAQKEPVVVITNWLDGALAAMKRGSAAP